MKILVTGAAGFIGYHLVESLLSMGHNVIGLDNINDYYDTGLKYERLRLTGIAKDKIHWNEKVVSETNSAYSFIRLNLEDKENLHSLFEKEAFEYVVHLAAQAGVRYSIQNPDAYIQSNIVGFLNILEGCRNYPVKHLVYASSSSVYGLNKTMPFSVMHSVDHPVSLYAATKKSNELMAHTYSHLYEIPTSGLRFFTVYGPLGRPDMAYFLFADAITKGTPIKVFNHGKMKRDFTFIDDIVAGIFNVMNAPPSVSQLEDIDINPSNSNAPYKVYNLGNNNPVELKDFIEVIEENLGKQAVKEYIGMQDGDVPATWANVDELIEKFNYKPTTTISEGLRKFIIWYKDYYKPL